MLNEREKDMVQKVDGLLRARHRLGLHPEPVKGCRDCEPLPRPSSDKTLIEGTLEIDHARGVIYFHSNDEGRTRLRICRLGPIPTAIGMIDITHKVGVSFT